MRKITEVLRLRRACGRSEREIAESLKLARSTVNEYLKRAEEAGLTWPLPEGVSESALEEKLFARPAVAPSRPLPDYEYIHNELRAHKRKYNLTLTQLWTEYKDEYPGGHEYTQFCEHYRRWLGTRDYCMRQTHKAGEKLFVDYCDGHSIVDQATGELIDTQLFVAVWGASNYTYAEASLSQKLPCWIRSHVHAFEYFGRSPHVLVPDNLKSGVTKPCFYEPELNRTYEELAVHYGAVILPGKPRKPRYKAKAEAGVLVSQRWILASLRHRVFFNLADLNAAIAERLEYLNTRPMRKLKKSRREVFETLDRPAALSLPERPYEYAEWLKARVSIDYRIDVKKHLYTVPFRLLHKKLDIRLTHTTLEAFYKGERVAAHLRSYVEHGETTLAEHMPTEHRKFAEWTPSRMIKWAAKTGPATALLVEKIMSKRSHPELGYRSCLGILTQLCKRYKPERVEAAAKRAVKFGTCSYRSMRMILSRGLDRQTDAGDATRQESFPFHENIRGGEYYH